MRSFLRNADASDYSSADDFSEAVFDEIKTAYRGAFSSARARATVKRTTKEIYSYYRLRDATPFGEKSPVKLKFGAPDTRAIRFFDSVDRFYFSTFLDNSKKEIGEFIKEEYLEKGAALFGRGTREELDDFRKAVGGKLDKINDFQVETIIQSSVQRTRNYAHINSLRQAKIELAKIVAILDNRCTTNICPTLNGKLIRVGVAAEAIDRLTELEPGDYAKELYKSDLGRAFASDPVGYVEDRISEEGVLNDDLIAEGRGFPPLHPRCRCRLEGVVEGASK
ncbi:MAG: hypothetical protein ICV60_05755 [Pyrinomonadaceae bacterium]|nr:hypothetical protein [Pyrinomonadaceae bacterium]